MSEREPIYRAAERVAAGSRYARRKGRAMADDLKPPARWWKDERYVDEVVEPVAILLFAIGIFVWLFLTATPVP